jgi:hypothetical protein
MTARIKEENGRTNFESIIRRENNRTKKGEKS